MSRTSQSRWGLVAALTLVATATTVGVPTVAAAAPGPCGPFGNVVTAPPALNDRCDYGILPPGVPADVTDLMIVDALSKAGLFATIAPCAEGGVAAVVAVPDEVLVSASNPQRLRDAVAEVRRRLLGSAVGVKPVNALVATITLRPGTLNLEFLLRIVPRLQGRGFSTDLNYLEPAQPNNAFRPGGDPTPVEKEPEFGQGGDKRVLVVDSPAQRGAHPPAPDVVIPTIGAPVVYDVDGNTFIDEDHGHGVYVASLIKRLAPKSQVVLAGVNGGHVPAASRWSPMMFSDADVMAAMGIAFGLSPSGIERRFDVVNLSLGGAGCAMAGRLAFGRFLRDLADLSATPRRPLMYVAAAGNDGGDVKHFPAAWRDFLTIELAATAVFSPPGAGDEIRQIHADLVDIMLAVGSWTGGGRDPFSNCGSWVNATAAGADTVSRYPSATTWASWSGTSFATARVSAALAGGQGLSDVRIGNAIGSC